MESKEDKSELIKVVDIKEANEELIEQTKCPDLENKFVHVKVGDAGRPATDADVEDMEEKLGNLFEENGINCITLVTHHAVTVEIIEKKGI